MDHPWVMVWQVGEWLVALWQVLGACLVGFAGLCLFGYLIHLWEVGWDWVAAHDRDII